MAPFIEWPEPHDVSLGVPPSRRPGMATVVENATGRPETVLSEESFQESGYRSRAERIAAEKASGVFGLREPRSRKSTPILSNINARVLDGLGDLLHALLQRRNRRRRKQSELSVLDRPNWVRAVARLRNRIELLKDDVAERGIHENSLTGHGANLDNAPMASAEGAISADGDIVRDGADTVPGSDSPAEQSAAPGAAASARPHHSPATNAGTA